MIVQRQPGMASFLEGANEGWSFVAVRGPIERVERILTRRPGILAYEPNVTPKPLVGNPTMLQESSVRRGFAIEMEGGDWTVLLRTVDWVTPHDALAVRQLAAALSRETGRTAISSAGTGERAASHLFRHGMEYSRVNTDETYLDLLDFFGDQDLEIPACFIGFDGLAATLYVESHAVDAVCRCDRVTLR